LIKEWHPTKNEDLTPEQIASGSHKKVWWKCPKGPDHEWLQSPSVRTLMGTGCPSCQGLQVSVTNSLATQYPHLAKEWHPKRNNNIKPENIVAFSNKKVWWVCPEGPDHEWQAAPSTRITQNQGCPFCAGKQVSVTNSLASLDPELAQEWHPTKNGNITPSMVTAGSGKEVWWKCSEGPDHEWQAPVNARNSGFGCPYCRGFEVSVTNSLAVLYPDIAKEWHPTKNGDTTPDQVVIGSGRKYWWQCSSDKSHEWPAQVYSRTKMGTGCPICLDMVDGARVSQVQRDLCDMLNGKLNQPLNNYNIDVAIERDGVQIAVEYDAWYWHGGREEYDSQRDAKMIDSGWRVLRIKSNKNLPTKIQLNKAILLLLEGETYTEIILDDWGGGPTKF
jgi:very-short-patch-repair endonuclease